MAGWSGIGYGISADLGRELVAAIRALPEAAWREAGEEVQAIRHWAEVRVSGMPLHTLTYTELRLITEGKIPEARRLHVCGHNTLMHRPKTAPIPYAS